MQEQEKKNKGFSLLEIIVVLAIVGALAGVGIPNFAKWNNKRIISNDCLLYTSPSPRDRG